MSAKELKDAISNPQDFDAYLEVRSAGEVIEDIKELGVTVTLRDQFAMSANLEDLPIPERVSDVAAYVGVSIEEYHALKHWPMAVAKARYEFADVMMEARKPTE